MIKQVPYKKEEFELGALIGPIDYGTAKKDKGGAKLEAPALDEGLEPVKTEDEESQQLMDEFFETTQFVGDVANWHDHVDETEESEDEPVYNQPKGQLPAKFLKSTENLYAEIVKSKLGAKHPHAGRPGKVGGSISSVTSHPRYDKNRYQTLKEEGYTDSQVVDLWDAVQRNLGGPQHHTLYHGTSKGAVDAILKEGLVPGKVLEGQKGKEGFTPYKAGKSEWDVSVYFSTNKNIASLFPEDEDERALLEIRIPQKDYLKLKQEGKLFVGPAHEQAIIIEGRIPPTWIRLISETKSKGPHIIYALVKFGKHTEKKSFSDGLYTSLTNLTDNTKTVKKETIDGVVKFVLWTKDGKRKLGTHDTYREAMAQEKAIEINNK